MPHDIQRRRRPRVSGGQDIQREMPLSGGAPPQIMPELGPQDGAEVERRRALRHLMVSPEDLGVIGAELTRRLTFAAEEYLMELAEGQVRDSFRQELSGMLHFDD